MSTTDIPYEELIGAALLLGIVDSAFNARRIDRRELEQRVRDHEPVEEQHRPNYYGDFAW